MLAPLAIQKYSIGVGDRFAHQGEAQLRACKLAAEKGVAVIPVWNKSHREHALIGSNPAGTRAAADAAVQALGWKHPYHVDADHIRLETVDAFLPYADFYTIDVADWIGKPAEPGALSAFVRQHPELCTKFEVPGVESSFQTSQALVENIAGKYLSAIQEAGKIYRHIEQAKGAGRFITEVSMDETDSPQTPLDLIIILAALADERVPVQTIAPKFTGRFNKGVDYAGDLAQFEKEFTADLAVLAFAARRYGLPASLKLSVHSGSDKFSLYRPIRRALKRLNAGVHLKTAGTTWIEELIGLAEAGGSGLELAKEIYGEALAHCDELCAPYASVIDIDRGRLPSAAQVRTWNAEQFVAALRHEPHNPRFNPALRQLLHVGYKLAAKKGRRYLEALETHRDSVARNVTANLFERHLRPLFLTQD